MTDAVSQILSRVESLTSDERAELAYALVCSLEPQADQDVDEAWDAELKRRLAEIRDGTAVGVPAEEVFKRLRASRP